MSSKSQQIRTQSPPTIWEEETDSIPTNLNYGVLIAHPLRTGLTSYCLTSEVFSFGRDANCTCSINSNSISMKHFEISIENSDGSFYITDLSRYGTFLNKEQISKGVPKQLLNGDTISAARPEFQIFTYVCNQDNEFLPIHWRRKYELSEPLGQGGFGMVKKIFDKKTSLPYAVKKISLNETMRIAINEINIFQLVNHPFIVKFREYLLTDEDLFIVMEYMSDGNLECLLLEEHLSESHIKYIFYQVAISIQYLHDKKIIHRDIKPENILVKKHTNYCEGDIVIKLTDFGLSKLLDKQSKAQTSCGTKYYAAPEVLQGLKYNYTADIWSLGVLLYYMFFKNIPDIVNEELSLDEQDFSNISDHVIALIKAMLVPEPSIRIKIDEIMEHMWIQEDEFTKQKLEAVFEQEKEGTSNEFEVPRFPFWSQRTVANLPKNRV